MNCSAGSVQAVAAVDDTLHVVKLRSAEGAQLSAEQRSRPAPGELQFKVHDVGRPEPLRDENIFAVSRKLASAEQNVARRRINIMKDSERGWWDDLLPLCAPKDEVSPTV